MSKSKIMGKSAVAGTEAATWTMGWAMAESLGFRPIMTPTGMVQSPARSKVKATRSRVAPGPRKILRSSGAVTRASRATILAKAYKIPTRAAAMNARETQVRMLAEFDSGAAEGLVFLFANCSASHSLAGRTVKREAK